MQIRIKLPNTQSYRTAEVREGANLSLQVRDNLTLEGNGRLLDIDLDFAITYENEAAFQFAHIATATTDLRNTTVTAYLQDGISEIEGEFTLSKASVTACNQVQYFGTFATQGATWYNALLKLCEYEYGNATQDAVNIINTFAAQAWQTGNNPLFYHSIYYTKPQTSNNLNTMETAPSVFIRAILQPIIQQIQSLGFTVDAPFFDTVFFRNLLFHNFAGWDTVKNIYASDTEVSANYTLLDLKPAGLFLLSITGEFMPYTANGGYNETLIGITQNIGGLITAQSTHPAIPSPILHSGSYDNSTGDYARFIAPTTAYYNIKCRYFGGKFSAGYSGFMIFKNGNPFYSQTGGIGSNTFDESINVNVLLQAGDILMWARHEVNPSSVTSPIYNKNRQFNISFKKINNIFDGADFKIANLLPCDTAAELLKGLTTMFNLAVFTNNKVVTIAPFYTVTLLTGETVQGFYRMQGKNELEPCGGLDVDWGANGQRSSDYFFSYKDDSKDANIQKGQLFASHILYPKSTEPQRRFDNSYFAPTYSKDGTCYLIDKTIDTSNAQWGGASFDHTPRILYRHGKITRDWNFNGVNLGYMPSAFMADDELGVSYLPYNNRNGELGLANRFWARWADFVQNAFAYQFEHAQILYTRIDMRSLVNLYGRWWIIDEVQNIQLGCDTGERITVKLLTFNP